MLSRGGGVRESGMRPLRLLSRDGVHIYDKESNFTMQLSARGGLATWDLGCSAVDSSMAEKWRPENPIR